MHIPVFHFKHFLMEVQNERVVINGAIAIGIGSSMVKGDWWLRLRVVYNSLESNYIFTFELNALNLTPDFAYFTLQVDYSPLKFYVFA